MHISQRKLSQQQLQACDVVERRYEVWGGLSHHKNKSGEFTQMTDLRRGARLIPLPNAYVEKFVEVTSSRYIAMP